MEHYGMAMDLLIRAPKSKEINIANLYKQWIHLMKCFEINNIGFFADKTRIENKIYIVLKKGITGQFRLYKFEGKYFTIYMYALDISKSLYNELLTPCCLGVLID